MAHLINSNPGELLILNPLGWQKLPTQEPYQFKPFGYRMYHRIEVHKIWLLWFDEMLSFLQMTNTGLCYPGICDIVIPSPREIQRTGSIWYTYPDRDKVANQARWAGYSVDIDGDTIHCRK